MALLKENTQSRGCKIQEHETDIRKQIVQNNTNGLFISDYLCLT